MKSLKQNGLTIVELMIVIVVIAIIASIALPSYQETMRKGRRADAKNELMEIAALQERFYSENGFYGSNADIGASATSDEGHYTIAVACTPDCTAANRPQQFLITATAVVADPNCGNFTYDQAGVATESGARGLDYCW